MDALQRRFGIGLLLFFLLVAIPTSARAFTMIDQDETAVVDSSLKDYNADGKPDGDLVLMTLFRSDRTLSFRTTYTFLLDSFLTDRDTNFKDLYHPGDLLVLNNFPMNPYAGLVGEKSGQQFVAFLRQNAQGHIIVLSMKMGPTSVGLDDKGAQVLQVKNVWRKDKSSGAGLEALQQDQMIPSASKEPLADFVDRVNRR